MIIDNLLPALHALLTGDSTLSSMVTGVYDHVPQRTDYPYVTMGNIRTREIDMQSVCAQDITLSLNVYSRAKGKKETALILARLATLLHDVPLTISGHHVALQRGEIIEITTGRDGESTEGEYRLRLVVSDA